MEPTWQSECGRAKLWLGDCLEVMASWPDGAVDAVVTDPPYGLGEAAGKNKSRGRLAVARDYGHKTWDDATNPEAVSRCREVSAQQVVWGGNYYDLPPTSCILVWDKMNGAIDFADCELAWTNLQKAVRLIRFRWQGMLKDGNDPRGLHPTQKPERVMAWAIDHTEGVSIADPFMGSGTTGVAALRLGRQFWGIEVDPGYFEIAKKRIQAELSRYVLFEPQPEQQRLFPEVTDAGKRVKNQAEGTT